MIINCTNPIPILVPRGNEESNMMKRFVRYEEVSLHRILQIRVWIAARHFPE